MFVLQYNACFEKHLVIDQILKYPANERWIAVSKDAYNYFTRLDDGEIFFRAKKYNIGILVVSQKQKIDIIQEPKEEKLMKDDFHKHYLIAKKIEESL